MSSKEPAPQLRNFPKKFDNKTMNAGLWYDKFFDLWDLSDNVPKIEKNKKLEWINTVTKDVVGDSELLKEYVERRKELIQLNIGKNIYFQTTSRFVSGIGRSHPIENGFTWHHTLGVPFLPGSSIKGMVRDWAKNWEKDLDNNSDTLKRIFGSVSSSIEVQEKNRIGSVIFMDAFPVKPVKLATDIMTPHYEPYYSSKKRNENPPADYYDPQVIPFLTVDKGQEFLFTLILGKNSKDDDIEIASKWLKNSIATIGAGAKTAVGYGRFKYMHS
ncbi:MAG: type III-B CRISPR module RAMP protein Cmr6 [Thermoplasmataceae archaeon]